ESGATVHHESLPAVKATLIEVTQILQNLVGNAVKYRADASPVIDVDAVATGADVIVAVTDNGRGVPEDQLERVFGMFERLEGDPFPGTGLGLAVCRKLVERLGGRIWMERNEGSGVTV